MFSILKHALLLVLSALSMHTATATDVLIYAGEDYPPIIYRDQQNQAQGVMAQTIANYEKVSGKKVTLELLSWRRAYEYARHGKGGVIALSKTKERQDIFDFSDVIYEDNINLVVRRGSEFPFTTLSDLKGKLIGVALGASYGDEVDTAIKNDLFRVDVNTNNTARLKKVLHQRVDAAIVSNGQVGLDAMIKADPELMARKNEFVILAVPLVRDPLYLGFAKSMKMTDFLHGFNQSLKTNKASSSAKNNQ